MQSLRRVLIPRRDNKSNIENCPRHFGQPRTVYVERIRPRVSTDENYDAFPSLPPYSPPADPNFNRPPSPAPSYCTVDNRTPPPRRTFVAPPSARTRKQAQLDPQIIVDKLIRRIRESMRNPKSWRTLSNGQQCFFWALRCEPGAADIFAENLDQIRNRVVLDDDWRGEKFCMMFKGQKLVDLWCRPIEAKVT